MKRRSRAIFKSCAWWSSPHQLVLVASVLSQLSPRPLPDPFTSCRPSLSPSLSFSWPPLRCCSTLRPTAWQLLSSCYSSAAPTCCLHCCPRLRHPSLRQVRDSLDSVARAPLPSTQALDT